LGAILPGFSPYLAMQAISVLATFLLLGASLSLAAKQAKHWHLPLAALLWMVCSAYFLRLELSTMSELPALGFLVFGIWLADKGKSLASMLFWGLAVSMRDPFALLALPFVFFESKKCWQNGQGLRLLPMLVAFALPFSIEWILLPSRGFEGQGNAIGHSFLLDWSPANFFRRSFENSEGSFSFSLPNILHVSSFLWHPGFGFPLLFALPSLLQRRFWISLPRNPIFWAMLLYVLLLAGLPMQNNRFLIPLPAFFLLLALPFGSHAPWAGNRMLKLAALFLLPFGLLLGIWGNRNFLQLHKQEIRMHELLQKERPSGRLYEFGCQAMLEARGLPYPMESMHQKLATEPQKGDLLLCNAKNLREQWGGLPPYANWVYFESHFGLRIIKEWPNGYTLYVLE
jgi:hypothetical protein